MSRRIVFDVGEAAPPAGAVSVPQVTPSVEQAASVPEAAKVFAGILPKPKFVPGETTGSGKTIKATSSYQPVTDEEKRYWQMYVDRYGRYPSQPDLKTFIPRMKTLEGYQWAFYTKLAELHFNQFGGTQANEELRRRIHETSPSPAAKSLLSDTTARAAAYLAKHFDHMVGLTDAGALAGTSVFRSLEELAKGFCSLGDRYYLSLIPPNILDEASVKHLEKPVPPSPPPYGMDPWEKSDYLGNWAHIPGSWGDKPYYPYTAKHEEISAEAVAAASKAMLPLTMPFPRHHSPKIIVTTNVPVDKAYQMGDKLLIHPEMAALLEKMKTDDKPKVE